MATAKTSNKITPPKTNELSPDMLNEADLDKLTKRVKENPPENTEPEETSPQVATQIIDAEVLANTALAAASSDDDEDDDESLFAIGGVELAVEPKVTADTNPALEVDADIKALAGKVVVDQDPGLITDEVLRRALAGLDDDTFLEKSAVIKKELDGYTKNLIVQYGMTPKEANIAAHNRLKKEAIDIMEEYSKTHPQVVEVVVDKQDADKLEFTDEEKSKLVITKNIKLVLVEEKELQNLKIAKVPNTKRTARINAIQGTLSSHSIPLPLYGDFVSFSGAQISRLLKAVNTDDATPAEILTNQANLIYDQLRGGTLLQKYGEDGEIKMSFNDFTNQFMFSDRDMAIYAILIASSLETSEVQLTCDQCSHTFIHKYSYVSLLEADEFKDNIKASIEEILHNRSDVEAMSELHAKLTNISRYKSPFSGAIYEVSPPTLAKAISMYRFIDEKDLVAIYASVIGLGLNTIYLYDKDADEYIEIDDSDTKEFMDAVTKIPQPDIDMLQQVLTPMLFEPTFAMNSVCPKCGRKLRNPYSVQTLVFLKAVEAPQDLTLV
jgi:predicted lactoylglutathione lyase